MNPAYVYPHEVLLKVRRIIEGRLVDVPLVIAPAGSLRAGGSEQLAQYNGEPVPIEFVPDDNQPIYLQLSFRPHGVAAIADLPLPDARPPAGSYYVGLVMAPDHTAELRLHGVGAHNTATWNHTIGRLPGDIP